MFSYRVIGQVLFFLFIFPWEGLGLEVGTGGLATITEEVMDAHATVILAMVDGHSGILASM